MREAFRFATWAVISITVFGVLYAFGVLKLPILDPAPEQQIREQVSADDRECLALQIWHPSKGAASERVMGLIGAAVRNYRKKTGRNYCAIFEQGLAETPDSMHQTDPLTRNRGFVRGEVRAYGKLGYAQQVAMRVLDGTYELPDDLAEVAGCATKFVRAKEGWLLRLDVSGGLATLRRGIEDELKLEGPTHEEDGFSFYCPPQG